MSDSRIHLFISYNCVDLTYSAELQFPQLTDDQTLLFDIIDLEELKGLEALVRSLAANDSYFRCDKCKYQHEKPTCYCKNHLEACFDSKLKVTFGVGTFSIWFEEPHIRVIEPLQPIEKVCKDLGVEIFYAQ